MGKSAEGDNKETPDATDRESPMTLPTQIRARLEAAEIADDWRIEATVCADDVKRFYIVYRPKADGIDVGVGEIWKIPNFEALADLIAHAPSDLAHLLAEVKRLEAKLTEIAEHHEAESRKWKHAAPESHVSDYHARRATVARAALAATQERG